MLSRMLSDHKSRSNDSVCTPQPVSQVAALQSHSILLVYSVITCAILTNSCTTHKLPSNLLNIYGVTHFLLSPTVAKLRHTLESRLPCV